MKKLRKHIICVAITAVTLSGAHASLPTGVNVLDNPGFEDATIAPWSAEGGGSTLSISSVAQTGLQSAQVDFTGDFDGIQQTLALDAGDVLQEYTLTGSVNTDGYTDPSIFRLGLWENSGSWTFNTGDWVAVPAGSSGWVDLSYTLILTDPDATLLRAVVQAAPQGSPKLAGHFLMDDASLIKTTYDAPDPTVNTNGGKEAGVFYSTLYAYDPAYRMTRITEFGVGDDLEQKLFGNIDGDAGGKDDAVAVFSSSVNASQDVWRVEVALSDGSDFINPSTWLTWITAAGSQEVLMGDVDGDGDEDLVFYGSGNWNAALSSGSAFAAPVLWSSGNGEGSDNRFLGDMNADGMVDAVISWTTWNGGEWRSGLSSGGGFGAFGVNEQGFGNSAKHFVGDLNNDGKADFIAYEPWTGNWDISINNAGGFVSTVNFETEFEANVDFATVYDVDNNGSGDLVIVGDDGDAWVRYLNNNLSKVEPRHRWITGGRSPFHTLYADAQTSIAAMDGARNGQLFCSYNGTWQAFPPNPIRSTTLQGEKVNTWESWANHYLPWYPTNDTPNAYGFYDSGDPDVNDAQIKQMHDLGFNYVMFDITNGHHDWVDDRAQAFMSRIRAWNANLLPGQHPMRFCISLGRTRGITDPADFLVKLEAECERAWDEFYKNNLDIVYYFDNKPLLIHMLDNNADVLWPLRESWVGPRVNYDRMTNRSFRGWGRDSGNAPYGWIVEDSTPTHDPNLMTIQPGFGNLGTFYSHDDGNRYKGHWLQVLENDPDSVFVVSWNEGWENNAIEPARMFRNETEAYWRGGKGYPPSGGEPGLEAYTDELGAQMDDYYFVMTRQYLKLFLDGTMEEGTYFKEESQPAVYQVTDYGFVNQTSIPPQAPILWLPDGYLASNATTTTTVAPTTTTVAATTTTTTTAGIGTLFYGK